MSLQNFSYVKKTVGHLLNEKRSYCLIGESFVEENIHPGKVTKFQLRKFMFFSQRNFNPA